MTKEKKILIIHDRFQFKGGAERLVLILAKALKADLMTEFWTEESFEIPNWLQNSKIISRQENGFDREIEPKPLSKRQKLFILNKGEAPWIVWRYFRAQLNFLFKAAKIVRRYDTVIFSGNNCLTASFNCKRGTKKILYCHSPVRHVFDLRKKYRREQSKLWKKIIYYDIGSWLIKFIYWLGINKMDIIIANSENIKNRLKNFIHQKTDYVIYPPIDINKFKYVGQGDYYLSFGRIEKLKRIPDIIRAFQQMPDKKLVVISGGPDLEKVKIMSKGYKNIKIAGWLNDQELANYLGSCIATIYIPIDEDFGMSPLESNAAGKPCIGVDEGGLKETIIDKKTGKLIPAKYTLKDLINAISWMTPERALAMRKDCEEHAKKFSKERFIKEMKEIVEK